MARPDKAASVAEITEDLRTSSATVVTEYRGLKVSEMKELRRSLGGDVKYAVVKNTLAKIGAREAGLPDLDSLLEGPTAIAFVKGDPVVAAKGLRDFARTHPALIVKGGVLESRAISPDDIRRLADLESREVLLAKLAGAMQASLAQAVYLLAAPLSQAARLLAALQETKPAGGDAAAAEAGDTATAEAGDTAAADAGDTATAAAGDTAAAETGDTPADAPAETTETSDSAPAE